MRHVSCDRCRESITPRRLTIVQIQDFARDPYQQTTKDLCERCSAEHSAWFATPPAVHPTPRLSGADPVNEGPALPTWLGGTATPATAATVGS